MSKKHTTLTALVGLSALWVAVLSASIPGGSTDSVPASDGSRAEILHIDKSYFSKADPGRVRLRLDILDAASQPYLGISQQDLRVFEDGVPGEILEFTGPGTQPLNVVLVIDRSGSMAGERLEGAKRAARAMIDLLKDGRDQIAIIAFDSSPSTVQPLITLDAQNRQNVFSALEQIQSGGGTYIAGPTLQALDLFRNSSTDGAKIILLMTDGEDQSLVSGEAGKRPLDQADLGCDQLGLQIYSISYGTDPTATDVLIELADRCQGSYEHAPTPEALKSIYADQVRSLESEFGLLYRSPFPEEDGLPRNLSVSISTKSGELLGTSTYQIGPMIRGATRRRPLRDLDSSTASSESFLIIPLIGGIIGGLLGLGIWGTTRIHPQFEGQNPQPDTRQTANPSHAMPTAAAPPPPPRKKPGRSTTADNASKTFSPRPTPPRGKVPPPPPPRKSG